jgi:predicted ArsR family transcriptional regulator
MAAQSQSVSQGSRSIELGDQPIDHPAFARETIGRLAETLESVVGVEGTEGFVSLVGIRLANSIQLEAIPEREPTVDLAEALVDFKNRIGGKFAVESVSSQQIVLTNEQCPFQDSVVGRTSLCMMTSNVLGTMAAKRLGYSQVELDETIAAGDERCRVTIHVQPPLASDHRGGREYHATGD